MPAPTFPILQHSVKQPQIIHQNNPHNSQRKGRMDERRPLSTLSSVSPSQRSSVSYPQFWSLPASVKKMAATTSLAHDTLSIDRPKTVAKRRSRSLSVWKDGVRGRQPRSVVVLFDESDDEPPRPIRRSRSVSPLPLYIKVQLDVRTVPKKRLHRHSSAVAPTRVSWRYSSKIHPSVIQASESWLDADSEEQAKEQLQLDRVNTASPVDVPVPMAAPPNPERHPASPQRHSSLSKNQRPRLSLTLEQAIYAAGHVKMMDPKRSSASRMCIANLMLHIQSIHPGVASLSELGGSASQPLAGILASESTSAPWRSDAVNTLAGELTCPSSPPAAPVASVASALRPPVITAPVKKTPSPVTVARKNNRKRLARLAAGKSIGHGKSPLRKELEFSSAALALALKGSEPMRNPVLAAVAGAKRKPSLLSLNSAMATCPPSVDLPVRPFSSSGPRPVSTGESEKSGRFSFPRRFLRSKTSSATLPTYTMSNGSQSSISSQATKRNGSSTGRSVWRFFKRTFLLEDPAKRSRRRESEFYPAAAAAEKSATFPKADHAFQQEMIVDVRIGGRSPPVVGKPEKRSSGI
ncbi:hypothetical protein HKX48_004488 [Thoreauomyces humboldtii]|nr:hypothetical protein HKX48_004488 [Thoreauomyces humboldtii]